MSALFLQKSAHHSEDKILSIINGFKKYKITHLTRPSNFLFQIARDSGATLSECTFFFEKAHVTKKTSRQTTSRPHDKKNPDRAISEFFLIKNPSICSGALRRRIRAIFKTRPSSSLFQIARGLGATPRWEYFFFKKKVHTTR